MASAQPIDWPALAPALAARLLGEPNKRLSGPKELRFGSNGSLAVDLEKGSFYSHEDEAGGGMLDLIIRERGGDTAAALAWLEDEGLKPREDRPDPVARLRGTGPATYVYRDADGRPAYRVQRKETPEGKTFVQHAADGANGWKMGRGCMDGVTRLPYRLPELLDPANANRAVFIVEGEKDADRLASLGLLATCNSGGAGKFVADLAPYFSGRSVVVIPDNDEPGRKHALGVVAVLRGVAEKLTLLPLDGLPEKGDVSDWLDAGGDVEDLKRRAALALADPVLTLDDIGIADATPAISATPYQCRDPREIPLRPWIYGRQLLRGSLSLVVAPGAVGKTALTIGTAMALVTGRSLLGKSVWDGPKRVWLWNLEDSADELARLIEAARKHWGITSGDIGQRLFVDSALEGAGLCVAVEDHAGFRIVEPVIDGLVDELKRRQIDVLVIDPFVSCHGASENDNGAIDAISKQWARVAVRANCSVVLVHHTKKLNGSEVTAEGARGASALVNTARSVVAVNRMAAEEAKVWNIEGEERRRYIRVFDDKNNRAPPAAQSDWYKLCSVDLGNGPADGHGDNLPVVVPWTPPDAFDGLTWEHLRDVQLRIGTPDNPGDALARLDPQTPEWLGFTVASVLGLDVGVEGEKASGPDVGRVKSIIKTWAAAGALVKSSARSEVTRKQCPVWRAGEPAKPESATR